MPSIFGDSLLDEFTKTITKSTTHDDNNGLSQRDCESENIVAQQKFDSSPDDDIQNSACANSTDSERIKSLEDEIERLKCLLKTTTCLFESSPIADITYFDNDLSRKFRAAVDHFINVTLSMEDVTKKKEGSGDTESTKKDENRVLARCMYFRDYVSKCYDQTSEVVPVTDWEIPSYIPGARCIVGADEKEQNESAKKRLKMVCFNCKGEHSVVNCPEVKDQARINANKNDFLSNSLNNSNSTPKNIGGKRYHAEENKYDNFKPGVVSNKLREAMGIAENELPPYIYNMRVLGYPPGHLLKAKNSNKSCMTIHGSSDKRSKDEQLEDGELFNEEMELEFCPEMIINYPGFNVQPPKNVFDDHLRLKMPAMQPFHNIDFMVNHLNSKTVRQGRRSSKRGSDDDPGISSKRMKGVEGDKVEVVDMDIEEEEEEEEEGEIVVMDPPRQQQFGSKFAPPIPNTPRSPPLRPEALRTCPSSSTPKTLPPPPPPLPSSLTPEIRKAPPPPQQISDTPLSPPPPIPDTPLSPIRDANSQPFVLATGFTARSATLTSCPQPVAPQFSRSHRVSVEPASVVRPEFDNIRSPPGVRESLSSTSLSSDLVELKLSGEKLESFDCPASPTLDDAEDREISSDAFVKPIPYMEVDPTGRTAEDAEVSSPAEEESEGGDDAIVCDDDDDDYVINIDDDEGEVRTEDEAKLSVGGDETEKSPELKSEVAETDQQTDLPSIGSKEADAPPTPPPETPATSSDDGTRLVPLTSSFKTYAGLPSLEKFSEGVVRYEMTEDSREGVGGFLKIRQALAKRKRK